MTQYGQHLYAVPLVQDQSGQFHVDSAPVQVIIVDNDDGSGDDLSVLQVGETFAILIESTPQAVNYVGTAPNGFVGEFGGQYFLLTTSPPAQGATISWAAGDYMLPEGDFVGPVLGSVTGTGHTITLVYDEPLDPGSVPSPSAFEIHVYDPLGDPVPATVTAVAVSGSSVILTIDASIDGNSSFDVGYAPGLSPIRDLAGNVVAAFSQHFDESQAPSLLSVSAGENYLILAFDEPLAAPLPDAGSFEVAIVAPDGSSTPVTVTSVDYGPGSGLVYLSLASALENAGSVKITYTPGANPLQDGAGNDAAAFEQVFAYASALPFEEHNTGAQLVGADTLTITSGMLRYSDAQDGPAAVTYHLAAVPDGAKLLRNGVELVSGATFTQDDIDNGRISYVVVDAQALVHGFAFVVTDSDGNSAAQDSFIISYTPPPNTPPYFGSDPTDGGLGGTVQLAEGATVVLDGDVAIFDAERDAGNGNYAGTSLTLARQGGANGDDAFDFAASAAFTVSGNALFDSQGTRFATIGQHHGMLTISFGSAETPKALVEAVMRSITYDNTSGAPPPSVVIEWAFHDGAFAQNTATGTTTVITDGQAPYEEHNQGATLEEVRYVTITDVMLRYADRQQDSADLLYHIAERPAGSVLLRDGLPLAVGDTFTQADIDAGLITYVVTDAGAQPTGFRFFVTDSEGNASPESSFAVDYNPFFWTATAARFGTDPSNGGLGGTAEFTRGGAAVVLDADVAIFDPDRDSFPPGLQNYAGTSLTLARQGGGVADDVFGFAETAAFTLLGTSLLDSQGVYFATVSQSGGSLTVTFDGAQLLKSSVEAVMRSITYANTSGVTLASVSIEWTLRDNDFFNGAATGITTVTIDEVNQAPTDLDLAATSVAEGSPAGTVVGLLSAVDVDTGQAHGYSLVTGDGDTDNARFRIVGNQLQVAAGANLDFESAAHHSVRIRVTDAGGLAYEKIVTISVGDVNDAPVLAHPLADRTAVEDQPFSFQLASNSFADVDAGDGLTYTATLANGALLPAWLSFDPATRTFSGMPANGDVGMLTVRVTATDRADAAVSDTFAITVGNVNDPPVVVHPLADQTAMEDQPFSFRFASDSFADIDAGDVFTYTATLANGAPLPAWLSFDPATRTFSGMPANGDVGTLTVRVTATDRADAAVADTFAITVHNVNDAPVVAYPLADQMAVEDHPFSFRFAFDSFADVDAGDMLTYTAALANGAPLPAWLGFNAATRTFSGVPANSDVGVLTVRVTATDRADAAVADTFTLTVGNVNNAPIVAHPIADQTATEDQPFSFRIAPDSFADADAGDTLIYAAALANGDPLPAWLSFDPATRTFSGTPANGDIGTLTVRVTATDRANAAVSDIFAITVHNVNDAPVVVHPLADQTATEDQPFSFRFASDSFADVNAGDVLTYMASLADGGPLPAWLSFNAATRNFSGTPGNGDVGALSVTVIARDGGGASISDTFTLTIGNVNDVPTIARPIADQAVIEDQPFSFQIAPDSFADVDAGDTIIYAATLANGDPLPAWLSFDPATRTFSGTPANGDVGTLTVRVTVTDRADAAVSDTFAITVHDVNDAPTGASRVVGILEDTSYAFSASDFSFADLETNAFLGITIVSLSNTGRLTLDGDAVAAGRFIGLDDLDRLAWTAGADVSGTDLHAFAFTVRDDGGTENGGADISVEYTLDFDVAEVVDRFIGTRKTDRLVATDGSDILFGKAGNDWLTGRAGEDQFILRSGDGFDTITDFDAIGADHDVLDLSGLASIRSFRDLKGNHLHREGKHVVIDGLDGDGVMLKNVRIRDLDAHDFLF
jgi:uncharacterized repeat protein (TIGR02059 family)